MDSPNSLTLGISAIGGRWFLASLVCFKPAASNGPGSRTKTTLLVIEHEVVGASAASMCVAHPQSLSGMSQSGTRSLGPAATADAVTRLRRWVIEADSAWYSVHT